MLDDSRKEYMNGVFVAGTVLAVAFLSLAPTVCSQFLGDRVRWVPDSGRRGTIFHLSLVLLLGIAVVVFVPGAPGIEWGTPDLTETVLILLLSPTLFVLGILTALVLSPFGLDPSLDTEPTDDGVIISLVAAALVGPAEELLFRGIVQPVLVDALGVVPGVVLMGILFGLYHYPNVANSPFDIDADGASNLALSGAGGVLLGVCYLGTGNLLVPVVGHSIHVAILFLFVLDD